MKEMTRLKTITSKRKIFLSPFVFGEEEAKLRVKRASKTFERRSRNSTELVKVSKYPLDAVWLKKKYGAKMITLRTLISLTEKLEREWEVMKSA